MKKLYRLKTCETLQPKVYVSWDRENHMVRNWNGEAVKDIIGSYEFIDGEYPDVSNPVRPARPGEIVVIESNVED